MRLSVIVITLNEAERLPACLSSVAFADEIVVVDSGSMDGTPELARKLGAQVVQTTDWPGFGPQKNRALALATGDWVLSIDADEQVTPALREGIMRAMEQGDFAAYSVNRHSSYCGQFIHYSGWYPDRVVRLFKRGSARFSDDLVHESLRADGPVGRISADLLHHTYPDFETVLDKVNRYSTAGALDLMARGVQGSFGKAMRHGLWAFLRTYVMRRGFLDGRMGLALAISNAQGTYYRYLKLWLLQRRTPLPGQPRKP